MTTGFDLKHLSKALLILIFVTLGCSCVRQTSGLRVKLPQQNIPQQTGRIVDRSVSTIRDDLVPLIEALQDRYHVMGISLVLIRGQEVLWQEGFGYADQAGEVPATAETIYRAGSLAKPLTAMSVLQLEQAADIDIDFPLDFFLTDFSIRSRFDTTAEPITVRSILTHHSGLPTDLCKNMWTDEPFTAVAANLKEEYAAYPPNLVYSYSNVGYSLLGDMVEQISGEPFADYIASHIFNPLRMDRSSMGLTGRPLAKYLSKGYRDGREEALLPIRDIPAMGLYTSAADLGRFMKMILARGSVDGREIVSPEMLKRMMEPQNRDIALDMDIVNGLGWFLEEDTIPGGGRVVRHGGTTLLFNSELILLPETNLGVAVLANSSNSRGIVSQLAEEILARALMEMPAPPDARFFVAKLEKDLRNNNTAEISGNYATDIGLISIRAKDAKICACIVEETFDLIPYPNGWFGIDQQGQSSLSPAVKPLAEMQFQTRLINGKEVVVAKTGDHMNVLGEKIPPAPIPEAWLNRVGSYELLNPDHQFPVRQARLALNNGHLCMSYQMPKLSPNVIQVPLRPISDTDAIILGLGRTRGETLRAVFVNGEERLRYSGYVGRKIVGHQPD